MEKDDLGFTYSIRANGELEITHHGRFATKFNKLKSVNLILKLDALSFHEQQQLMARLTGNYKHGNERVAKNRRK